MQIQPLTIKFSLVRGRGWTSQLISWFGGGGYSHIDTITPQGMYRGARSDSIGGQPPGFWDRPAHYEKWARQTIFTLPVTPTQFDAYWRFSDAQLGKPYDSRGLVESFIFGRDWRQDDSWFCSEIVAAALENAGILQRLPVGVTKVNPGDCAFILTSLGATWKDEPT